MRLVALTLLLTLICSVSPFVYAEDERENEREDDYNIESEENNSEQEDSERGFESQTGESERDSLMENLEIGEREGQENEREESEEDDSASSGPILYVVIGAILAAIGYTAFKILHKAKKS